MKNIFVDGYNIIHSWPKLKEVKDYNFDSARQELLDILQNYAEYKDCRIFLVFDAHMVSGSIEEKKRIGNVIIVFTKEGETADSFIEKTVDNIGRKQEVCVVTSDSLEQQVAFQRGATRMSSMEFYFEVKNVEEKINAKSKEKKFKQKLSLEDRIEKDILQKLEKIRRNG